MGALLTDVTHTCWLEDWGRWDMEMTNQLYFPKSLNPWFFIKLRNVSYLFEIYSAFHMSRPYPKVYPLGQ
jgi:hypothetical protein